MATHFFDGDRLVLDHSMMWVAGPDSSDAMLPWTIRDTEGGAQYYPTKQAARDRLARYAKEG